MWIGYVGASALDRGLDLREDSREAAGRREVHRDEAGRAEAGPPGLQGALADVRPGDRLVARDLDRLGHSGRKGGRPRDLDDKTKRHAFMLHGDPTHSIRDLG